MQYETNMADDIMLEYMQWKQRGMVDHGRVRFSHSAFSSNLFTLFQSLLSPRWAMFCVQVPISQTRPLDSDF